MDPVSRIPPQVNVDLFKATTLRQSITPREIQKERSAEEARKSESQSPKEGAQLGEVRGREVKGSLDVEA